MVVDDINIQKKLFHYTFGQGKIGGIVFFNDTDLRPEVGQCLKIFYCVTKDRKGEKRPIVLNVEETAEINTSAIKTIQGHLELKYKNGSWDDSPDFAFIGDYYVHHSVLCEYNITKDCYVTADVIYAGQGKWKVIKNTSIELFDKRQNISYFYCLPNNFYTFAIIKSYLNAIQGRT